MEHVADEIWGGMLEPARTVHPSAFKAEDNAIPTGYDRHNMRTTATQIHLKERNNERQKRNEERKYRKDKKEKRKKGKKIRERAGSRYKGWWSNESK